MIPKQQWSHMTRDILGKTLVWPQIMTCVTSALNSPSTNFFPLWLNITKLLIQCPLMSWPKFHYHKHQWHLTPHFMTHIAIVKYKQKYVRYYDTHFYARKVGMVIDLIINHNLWPHKKLYVIKCQLVGLKLICSWTLKQPQNEKMWVKHDDPIGLFFKSANKKFVRELGESSLTF